MKPSDLISKINIPPGWSPIGTLEVYAGEKLVDYINGGAELYFAYNFKEVAVRKYCIESDIDISLEIYEMDRPENAYGVYSFDTDGQHPDVGQDATYSDGLLRFWKGRYFVRIFVSDETERLKNELAILGSLAARVVQESGSAPTILKMIPEDGLIPESIHYFHKNVCLNNFYYLSDDNILNLDAETEAVTYECDFDGGLLRIILVQYPNYDIARDAYISFMSAYFRDAEIGDTRLRSSSEFVGMVEQGVYSGVRIEQRYLILVFEAETESSCRGMLEMQSLKLE
jgi:hypothetical protein